jgi:hypothetical protein
MKTVRRIALALLVFWPLHNAVAEEESLTETNDTPCSRYAWITSVSNGPMEWKAFDSSVDEEELPFEVIRGSYFRVVVTTAEATDSYHIERITVGGEGCCKQVASATTVDTLEITMHFGLKAATSFEPVEWTSPTSYIFVADHRRFEFRELDRVPMVVELGE